ncbi:Crp/Fnr family transcriptional regulator [Ensifer soli]|uniref:Crp/Fnr family transcriptional regulator n=1 Tax=Ciceribacter sp. sgz301302 TaxID=3342379 RepID=UPI0035BA8808
MLNPTPPVAAAPVLPIDQAPFSGAPAGGAALRLLLPGTALFLEGLHAAATVRILSGCVCLHQTLSDGRRQILDILGPGRMLGAALLDTQPAGALALTFTRLEPVDPEREPEALAGALRLRLARAQAHVVRLGRRTAQERIAAALLDLSGQFARRGRGAAHTRFTLYPKRADLADWLGLTVETVSRCLNAFRREGLIAFDRPEIVTIRDRAALERRAAGGSAAGNPSMLSGQTGGQP